MRRIWRHPGPDTNCPIEMKLTGPSSRHIVAVISTRVIRRGGPNFACSYACRCPRCELSVQGRREATGKWPFRGPQSGEKPLSLLTHAPTTRGYATIRRYARSHTVISFSPRLAQAKYGISVAVTGSRSAGAYSRYSGETTGSSTVSAAGSRHAGTSSLTMGRVTLSTSPRPFSSSPLAPAWKSKGTTLTAFGSAATAATSACSRGRFPPLSWPSAQKVIGPRRNATLSVSSRASGLAATMRTGIGNAKRTVSPSFHSPVK